MWEATRFPVEHGRNLKIADHIIVPCQWSARNFRDQLGCDVSVAPLGHNPEAFFPSKPESSRPFTFGTGGRNKHGMTRKQTNLVINCFIKAFPREDARLLVKCHPGDGVIDPGDTRVQFCPEMLTERQMGDWFRSIDAYVSASRGEGWGLFQHQALACGRPVIGPLFGGLEDFCAAANTIPVAYDLMPTDTETVYGGEGMWAIVKPESLISAMRHAFANPDGVARMGEHGARDVAHLTWDNHCKSLHAILQRRGFFK